MKKFFSTVANNKKILAVTTFLIASQLPVLAASSTVLADQTVNVPQVVGGVALLLAVIIVPAFKASAKN